MSLSSIAYTTEIDLTPIDDCYDDRLNPDTTYNNSNLIIRNRRYRPRQNRTPHVSWLKFDLSGISGAITNVTKGIDAIIIPRLLGGSSSINCK